MKFAELIVIPPQEWKVFEQMRRQLKRTRPNKKPHVSTAKILSQDKLQK
jgi:hypothetical protein